MVNKWKPGMDNRVIYKPKNLVATYVDSHGEERVIHSPKGRSLRRFDKSDTPQRRLNRAVAILLGHNIRDRRLALGLSQKDLCIRAGIVNSNPKQFISGIERAQRAEGMRLGTLFALATALECEPGLLLPSTAQAMETAGVGAKSQTTLEAFAA